MAIKNYRTKIAAAKTVGEIQELLGKAGCSGVTVDYRDGEVSAVSFSLPVSGRNIWFRLPANAEGVLATMKRDRVQSSYCNLKHANNIAWRIIKDWVHAQLAIVDAGQAKMAEVFFSYALQDGETLYSLFESKQKQLGTGEAKL